MQNTQNKIISAITGATMLLGGLVASDVAVESPTEKLETALATYNLNIEDVAEKMDITLKLETALAPYNLTIEDITPFTQEKIDTAKTSEYFTYSEEAVLTAILKGQGILYYSDGNIEADKILDTYAGILNKSEIKYEDIKDITDINKLIRQKYE